MEIDFSLNETEKHWCNKFAAQPYLSGDLPSRIREAFETGKRAAVQAYVADHVMTLFPAVAHGEPKHHAWLEAAIMHHFGIWGSAMVGGIVVHVKDLGNSGDVWVLCHDVTYLDTCSVALKKPEGQRAIAPGDHLWWQGGTAYWTPATHDTPLGADIKLEKHGGSGVSLATAREVRGIPQPPPKRKPTDDVLTVDG